MATNFEVINSNMTLICEIDEAFINYSYHDDKLSFGCQTTSDNNKNWYVD